MQKPNNFTYNMLLQEKCRILCTEGRFELTICHNVGWTQGAEEREMDDATDLRNIMLEHCIIQKFEIFLSGLFQPLCLILLG